MLSNSDLQIYLTLLILSKSSIADPKAKKWPPTVSEILKMERDQLLRLVFEMKE